MMTDEEMKEEEEAKDNFSKAINQPTNDLHAKIKILEKALDEDEEKLI